MRLSGITPPLDAEPNMDNLDRLESIADRIRMDMEAASAARDEALSRSRELTRHCAGAIKAVHREDWVDAQQGLDRVREAARMLIQGVEPHPDLYHSGYTQDALKEYVEAFATYALVRNTPLPSSADLDVPGSTYLNGLAEAASELRRTILDAIRQEHSQQAERLLETMDSIYNLLMTFDFPDAITYGLRRRVDNLRGVLERTRGDLTNSLRQQRLQVALKALESRLDLRNEFPDMPVLDDALPDEDTP
jgi:translin